MVQLYIIKVNDTNGPLKTLKGFQRVKVSAGKTQDITINLPYNSFEFFNIATGKMAVSPGEYEVLYGNSSDSKDLKIIRITLL